jgi:preprotein translocase subunit SecB
MMVDQSNATNGADPNSQAAGGEPGIQILLNAQYLKDLSFESPAVPQSLMAGQQASNVSLGIDVAVQQLDAERFEVVLNFRGQAQTDNTTVFLIELAYAGLFTLSGIPQDQLQPILFIEAPRLLFPFARAIVADVTRDGGFPPLLVNPVDFVDMYRRRLAEAQQQAGQASA